METFEEGELISRYVGKQGRYNRQLADLGLHCYLKMLIKDNFIHADLVGGVQGDVVELVCRPCAALTLLHSVHSVHDISAQRPLLGRPLAALGPPVLAAACGLCPSSPAG